MARACSWIVALCAAVLVLPSLGSAQDLIFEDGFESADTSRWTSTRPAVIDVVIEASVSSGVAPLVVFFDASGSTAVVSARPFHELSFAWDFDDPAAGTWATSGRNKNLALGPVAAHVFDTPGSYTVQLRVSAPDGFIGVAEVAVQVDDPELVFAGASTICVSQASDFTACPVGAQQVVGDFDVVSAYLASGRRILLRRGETFSCDSTMVLNLPGPGLIGAFGSGERPRIESDVAVFRLSGSSPQLEDWRIMDLELASTGSAQGIFSEGTHQRVLLYRLWIHDFSAGVLFDSGKTDWYGHPLYDVAAIAECSIHDTTSAWCAYVAARRLVVLGNDMHDSAISHVLRVTWTDRAVISDNHLADAGFQRHVLKMHAPCHWSTNGSDCNHPDEYTQKVVISGNRFAGEEPDWPVAIAPRNGAQFEPIRDVIVEANHFLAGAIRDQMMLYIDAEDVSVRNNVFSCSDLSNRVHVPVYLVQRGIGPLPRAIDVRHNSVYSGDSVDLALVRIEAGQAEDVLVRNNLISAPNAGNVVALSGTGTDVVEQNNLVTDDPGFITDPPVQASDFQITAGSPAEDQGLAGPVLRDFLGTARPQGSAADIGAFELIPPASIHPL